MNEDDNKVLVGNYSDIEPNSPLPISNEEVEVCCNGKIVKGEGNIELHMLPSLRLKIQIDFPSAKLRDVASFGLSPEGNIKLSMRNISTEATFSNRSFGSHKPLRLTAIPTKGPLETNSRKKISYIIFYLLNYWDFIGSNFIHKTDDGGSIRGNRLFLEDDVWKITIESLATTSKRIDILKNNGGYGITHIGKLERVDKKGFTSKKAEDILEALFYILSFSRGFWIQPILPIGYSRGDIKTWELWANHLVSPWKSVLTWCDHHNMTILSSIFSEFIKRWNDPDYKETIKAAIYWYIRSNTNAAGTDGSIVLTQAALERLSWDYHVNIKKSMSPNGFEKLPASDRIKLLLSQSEIPLAVPKNLTKLSSISKRNNFDGPSVFTTVRNRIVHPGRKKSKESVADAPLFECWNLGLWYLELLLLSIFKCNDDYANRLKLGRWVGQTEKVPWYNTEQSA